MKTYEQIQKALEEELRFRVKEGEEATAEAVAETSAAVREKASSIFGAGVYVSGKLNVDAQGVSFTYKRPSLRQRMQFFVPARVAKPPRNPEAGQHTNRKRERSNDAQHDDTRDPGAPDAERTRLDIMLEAVKSLKEDQFTQDGRPQVDALNDALGEGVEPFTAPERDQLWKDRPVDNG